MYLGYIRQSKERNYCELVGISAVNPMVLSKDDRHKKRMKMEMRRLDTTHTSPSDLKEVELTFILVCFDGDEKYHR